MRLAASALLLAGAALLAVFFGYANFVLAGYFKDVDADRATGYHTLPVVFGGLLLKSLVEGELRSPWVIAVTTIVFGLLLGWVDLRAPRERDLEQISGYFNPFMGGMTPDSEVTFRLEQPADCSETSGFQACP